MIDILGVVGEKIDEENVRLRFADGSSICLTFHEEEKGDQPTVAHLVRLILMEGFTKQPEPGAVSIGDKPGIH